MRHEWQGINSDTQRVSFIAVLNTTAVMEHLGGYRIAMQ